MDEAIRQRYAKLFDNQGFLAGIGSIMNLWPADADDLQLEDVRPYASDSEALSSDWERIGEDMWRAIGKVEQNDSAQKS